MSETSYAFGPEQGWLILVALGTFVVNFWQMVQVGKKRREFGIEYPAMYSDKHPDFNCVQRCHQNTLERLPLFLLTLFVGGLRYPSLAFWVGELWIVARVIYTLGYASGNPEGRIPGALLSFVSEITLFTCSVLTALGLMQWI